MNANTRYKLFTQVEPFYADLVETLPAAQERITMMYFTFDHGVWSEKIARELAARAAAGVEVRLMVDAFGLALDAPRHAFRNLRLLAELQATGVQVERFRPRGHRLDPSNRLHAKICALDDCTAFIGGSNIGDHYIEWDDHNLRLDGDLGAAFHDLFDFTCRHSSGSQPDLPPDFHLSRLFVGGAQIFLTVPKQRYDIRRALLDLILDADREVCIRNWYFLPDREILNALRSQAQQGISVNVLLSHRTRVPVIDRANYVHGHKLAKSGGNVYRFTGGFMHAKVAWNDRGTVLFGSANLDATALKNNFECSIVFRDFALAGELRDAFEADKSASRLQTPTCFNRRPLPKRAVSYVCSLASPWM